MSPDLDKKLVEDFPIIFRDRHGDKRETSMCWGFTCGDGWEPLIRTLCSFFQFHADRNNYPQAIASQVKQKWGRLNFHYFLENCTEENMSAVRFLQGAESFAAIMSESICEVCGMPGKLRTDMRWISTLCDTHYQQSDKRIIKTDEEAL